jgi:hypothetical protein
LAPLKGGKQMKYIVKIYKVPVAEVEVEAENKIDARNKVLYMATRGDIKFSVDFKDEKGYMFTKSNEIT